MAGSMGRRPFLGLAAAGLWAGGARGQETPPGLWEARADMPWPAQEIYCAALDGQVAVAGGLSGQGGGFAVLDRSAFYDPAADLWTEGPRLPAPRHHLMLVAAGGRVWAFGGYGATEAGDWVNASDVHVLDGAEWREAGRLPGPQAETVGLALDGGIHLVAGRAPGGAANAGWGDQADLALHRRFDPATGGWETAAPLPVALNSAAGAVIGGALYLAGGRTTALANSDRLFRYDPGADRWEELAPMPAARAGRGQGGLAAAALGGRLVVMGGEYFDRAGGGVFAETWEYDPAADRWRALAPMRTPRHGHAAVASGDTVLTFGGSALVSVGDTRATVEALRLPG